MKFEDFLSKLEGLKRQGDDRATALCPAHDDHDPSLSLKKVDDRILVHCFSECDPEEIVQAMGLTMSDLFFEPRSSGNGSKPLDEMTDLEIRREWLNDEIEAAYLYYKKNGTLSYEVVRYVGKGFAVRRVDPGDPMKYICGLGETTKILYNLPMVADALALGVPLVIAEGEKDVDNLLGFLGVTAVATCNPFGAGKWKTEYSEELAGFTTVYVLADNDAPGRKHANQVAESLTKQPGKREIKIIELPGLPESGDVSDWIAQCHTSEEFWEIVNKTQVWSPGLEQNKKKSLELVKLGDLLKEPEEKFAWVVEDLLTSGGLSGLIAKVKKGKSTLARQLCYAIATGSKFLGRTTTQGPVFFISLEEKRQTIRSHFQKMGATGEEEIYIFAGAWSPGFVDKLIKAVKEYKPVLVVLDTLFRVTKVKKVSEYAEVGDAVDPLIAVAHSENCHVMALHHAKKGSQELDADDLSSLFEEILGSANLGGSLDVGVFMKADGEERTIAAYGRGVEIKETLLTFDPETQTMELGEPRDAKTLREAGDKIRQFLEGGKRCTEKEIRAGVKGKTGLLSRVLREEFKAGRILREGPGGKKDPYRYFLPVNSTGHEGQSATRPPSKDDVPAVPSHTREHGEHQPIKGLHGTEWVNFRD